MKLGKGEADKMEGFNQATFDMMKKYGLTEAEILAVKVYTASDYKYINPATANNESWMKDQITPPKKTSPKAGSSKGSSAASEEDRDLSNLLEPEPEDRDLTTLWTAQRRTANSRRPWGSPTTTSGSWRRCWKSPRRQRDLKKMLGRAPEEYFDTEEGKKHLKRLFEEGSLHGRWPFGGAAKAASYGKTVLSRARMTEADFTDRYGTRENPKLPSWTLPSLTSVATTGGCSKVRRRQYQESRRRGRERADLRACQDRPRYRRSVHLRPEGKGVVTPARDGVGDRLGGRTPEGQRRGTASKALGGCHGA